MGPAGVLRLAGQVDHPCSSNMVNMRWLWHQALSSTQLLFGGMQLLFDGMQLGIGGVCAVGHAAHDTPSLPR